MPLATTFSRLAVPSCRRNAFVKRRAVGRPLKCSIHHPRVKNDFVIFRCPLLDRAIPLPKSFLPSSVAAYEPEGHMYEKRRLDNKKVLEISEI